MHPEQNSGSGSGSDASTEPKRPASSLRSSEAVRKSEPSINPGSSTEASSSTTSRVEDSDSDSDSDSGSGSSLTSASTAPPKDRRARLSAGTAPSSGWMIERAPLSRSWVPPPLRTPRSPDGSGRPEPAPAPHHAVHRVDELLRRPRAPADVRVMPDNHKRPLGRPAHGVAELTDRLERRPRADQLQIEVEPELRVRPSPPAPRGRRGQCSDPSCPVVP